MPNSLRNAIFLSEVHLECQMPEICKGCQNPWEMPYSPVKFTRDARNLQGMPKSLRDAIFPSAVHSRCQKFARDAKIPGDAIFPSEVHSECQMPEICMGCQNPWGMPYSPVKFTHNARCLKFARDAKIPGGCHIPQ